MLWFYENGTLHDAMPKQNSKTKSRNYVTHILVI